MEINFVDHPVNKFRPFEPTAEEKPLNPEWIELRNKFKVLDASHYFGGDVDLQMTGKKYSVPTEQKVDLDKLYSQYENRGYKNETLLTLQGVNIKRTKTFGHPERQLQLKIGECSYFDALSWLDKTPDVPNPNAIVLSALVRTRDDYLVFAERSGTSSAGKEKIGVIGGTLNLNFKPRRELLLKGTDSYKNAKFGKDKLGSPDDLVPEDPFFAMRDEVESELGLTGLFKQPDNFEWIMQDDGHDIVVRESDGKVVSSREADRTPANYPIDINMTSIIRDIHLRPILVFEVLLPITRKRLEKLFGQSENSKKEHNKLLFVPNYRKSLVKFANSRGLSAFHEPAAELILMGELESTRSSVGEVVSDARYLG